MTEEYGFKDYYGNDIWMRQTRLHVDKLRELAHNVVKYDLNVISYLTSSNLISVDNIINIMYLCRGRQEPCFRNNGSNL